MEELIMFSINEQDTTITIVKPEGYDDLWQEFCSVLEYQGINPSFNNNTSVSFGMDSLSRMDRVIEALFKKIGPDRKDERKLLCVLYHDLGKVSPGKSDFNTIENINPISMKR
jgi:hypothetical protein